MGGSVGRRSINPFRMLLAKPEKPDPITLMEIDELKAQGRQVTMADDGAVTVDGFSKSFELRPRERGKFS